MASRKRIVSSARSLSGSSHEESAGRAGEKETNQDHWPEEARRELRELQDRQAELERENERLRGIWNNLPGVDGYARRLIEASLDPLVAINQWGVITDVNMATVEITGVARERLIGSEFAGYFTDPDKARAGYEQAFAEGQVVDCRLSIRHVSGGKSDVIYNATVYQDEQGRVAGVFAAARDITSRLQSEETTRRQAALINSLLDSIPDIIFFKDTNGIYLGCNPPFAEFVGRPRHEIIGKSDHDLFDKDVADFFREHDRRMLELLEPRHNEEWITYPDGRKKLIDTLKTPYWGPDGDLIGVLGISRDITVQTHNRDELAKVSERLSLAARAAGIGIWEYDVAGNELIWDDQMYLLYGIGREQFGHVYEAWQAGLHPDDRRTGHEAIQRALEGEREFNLDFRVLRPDGDVRHIHAFATVQRDASGKPLRMIGTNWDVTGQTLIQHEMVRQSAMIRSLLDGIPDVVFFKDANGVCLDCNLRLAELLGKSLDEIIGKTDYELFDKEKADTLRITDLRIIEDRVQWHNEEWVVHHDGRQVLYDTIKTPFLDEKGKAIGVIGVSRDITERTKLQNDLQRITQRFELAATAGGVGVWDAYLVHDRVTWDERMYQLYGISPDRFGGTYQAWIDAIHPDDRQMVMRVNERAIADGRNYEIGFRVLRPDGSIRHLKSFGLVQRNESGVPLRIVGTNWDVTDQILANEEISRQAAFIRSLLNSIPDVIYYKDVGGVFLGGNQPLADLIGHPLDEIIGKTNYDFFNKDIADELRKNDLLALDEGKTSHHEDWVTAASGDSICYDTMKTPLRDLDGKIMGVLGVSRNATERKRMELRLRDSEESYRNQFYSNLAVMLLIDPLDARILDANRAAQEFYGYTREEMRNMMIGEINMMDEATIHANMAKIKKQEGKQFEFKHRLADGSLRDVEVLSSLIAFGGREILHSIIHDVTARRQAEAGLARISEIQRNLMNLATEFVNVPVESQDGAINRSLEMMGQLIRADRAYLFLHDHGSATTYEWCSPCVIPQILNMRNVPVELFSEGMNSYRVGKPVVIPDVASLPEGGVLRDMMETQGILSLVSMPLMNEAECIGLVGFDSMREKRVWREDELSMLRVMAELYTNFEARRNKERENQALQNRLVEARSEAEAAATAKSLFLANMSHEIRTPLNAILGYTQIMGARCGPCQVGGEGFRMIKRSGEHLLALITDIMELVRTDGRTITTTPVDFDFHKAVQDVCIILEQMPERRNLRLNVSLAPDVPHIIRADEGKIRQILVNIAGNALKFTEVGYVCLSARLVPGGNPEKFTIAVDIEDTGCGIDDGELDHIFDIFGQATGGRNSRKGAGLGLPLSRRYARVLGGDITVTSRLGEGSCFRFTFAASRVDTGSEAARTRPQEVTRLVQGGRDCRVLVVDDDPTNRNMLSLMLANVGFTVEAADHAGRALELLHGKESFGVILMDKFMPDVNGYEAIRRIREIPGRRDTPVLVVTASGMAGEDRLAFSAGADGYVSKPVDREDLLREIGRVAGVTYEYEEVITHGPAVQDVASPEAGGGDFLSADATIMIIDDKSENLEMLGQMLRRNGWNVRAFASGDKALASARMEAPDLVLLDIRMPDMDGYEVCRLFKEDETLRSIPIIFLSAVAEDEDKVRAFEVGGVDYVTKPFAMTETLARVRTHLRLYNYQNHLEELVRQRVRDLEEAHRRLRIWDGAKSDWLKVLSHEMLTPLNGIFGITDILFMDLPPGSDNDGLQESYNLSRARMEKLVADALTLAQIDVASEKFAPSSLSLRQVMQNALAQTAATAPRRELRFPLESLGETNVLGDRKLLERAFADLLLAAAHCVNERGSIMLNSHVSGGRVRVEIITNGESMPPDAMETFFEVGGQRVLFRGGGDFGLGPALASRIIRLFAGQVSVRNGLEQGVVLDISLPITGNSRIPG